MMAFVLTLSVCLACPETVAKDTDARESETREIQSSEKPLAAAVAQLLSQQGDDGLWHSEHYGALKQGAAVSSLAVYALSNAIDRKDHAIDRQEAKNALAIRACRRAVATLLPESRKRGYIINPDGSPDFPTYCTALILLAHEKIDVGLTADDVMMFQAYIRRAQLDERRSFGPESQPYGGWDLMGPTELQGVTSGANVSIAAFALEALKSDTSEEANRVRSRALQWTRKCQNLSADDGFPFTSDPKSQNNKAGLDKDESNDRNEEDAEEENAEKEDTAPGKPVSYGSPTCDGLRCLIATGAGGKKPSDGDSSQDKDVKRAISWLVKHPDVSQVPGFEATPESGWAEGLRFYYYSTLSQVLKHLPAEEREKRSSALLAQLKKEQKNDGRFVNASARMREDDPLIATAFAIIALAELP